MAFTGKLICIWLTISSCYYSIRLSLLFVERNGGLSTTCHSCVFDYQKGVLETFTGLANSAQQWGSLTKVSTGKFVGV